MRDLIAAFTGATRAVMTEAGWRKRSGDVYSVALGDGFHATLGLNRSSTRHPLAVNPVVGVRYEPLERLMAELLGADSRSFVATLAKPIGYLMPERRFLQVQIAACDDAHGAAEQIRDLAQRFGLPFAHGLANIQSLMVALEGREYLPNPERARLLLPALHYLRGDPGAAQAAVSSGLRELEKYGQDPSVAVVAEFERFAGALNPLLES